MRKSIHALTPQLASVLSAPSSLFSPLSGSVSPVSPLFANALLASSSPAFIRPMSFMKGIMEGLIGGLTSSTPSHLRPGPAHHLPSGAGLPAPGLEAALKALVAPDPASARALLDDNMDFDKFLEQMRKALEFAQKFRDQLHRFIPGADIGEGIDVGEGLLEIADEMTAEEKKKVTEGTISASDVLSLAQRCQESPTLVIQLIGTYDSFVVLKRIIRERLAKGDKVHGLSVSEAMELVGQAAEESKARLNKLAMEVLRTPPPPGGQGGR